MSMQGERLADVKWATAAFSNASGALYQQYDDYITGDQPISFGTKRFESAFGKSFASFAYNRCDNVVDAISDRLQVLGFAADDKYKTQAKRANELWKVNHMDIGEAQIEDEALGMGDGYVIAELHPTTNQVQLWPQRARNIRVRYSEDLVGHIELGARMWIDRAGYGRLNLYYKGRIEKFRTREKRESFADGIVDSAWEEYKPPRDRIWPVPLPIKDTVPVFHVATNARVNEYGVSELRSVIPIQDALNKSVMDMLVAQEFTSFPIRFLINVDLDDPKSQDRMNQLEVGINRWMALVGSDETAKPDVREFGASDVKQYIGPIDLFDTLISRSSKVPVHYLQMTGNFPSGASLRTAEAPFVAKLVKRQHEYGATFEELMRYSVRLTGLDCPAGVLRCNWESPMPLSEQETLQLAEQRMRLGFPLKTNLKHMGYDEDQLKDFFEDLESDQERRIRAFNAGNIDAAPPRAAFTGAVQGGDVR